MKKLFGSAKPKPVKSSVGSVTVNSADTPPSKTTKNGHPSFSVASLASLDSSNSTPVTSSAPPSPDSLAHRTQHNRDQPVPRRERAREQDRSDLESRAARSSSDEHWEVVHPPDRDADGPGPLPNPHSPALISSRSSSFASLPPGASPPVPSPLVSPLVTSGPAGALTVPPPNASPILTKTGNLVVSSPQMLRKKATPNKETSIPSAGAASILRALDPQKHFYSDRSSVHTGSKNDSVESLLAPSFHSENERDSEELERERLWRQRDREIRETEAVEGNGRLEDPLGRGREGKRNYENIQHRETDNKRDREKVRERDRSDERKEDKKMPWGGIFSTVREKEREKDKEREKEQDDSQADQITRMIGYLTATASEDWALVLEVCERASSNESNAKEAAKALRREFKYADPSAQLSAARLWAIMLRNSSEFFIAQTSSKRFLDTLEDVLTSSRTSPVVRERLMDVLAAAAFASTGKDGKDGSKEGFRGLWRKLKPDGKSDEGVPFQTDDVMFNPVIPRPISQSSPPTENASHIISSNLLKPQVPVLKQKHSSRNRVIPLDEDIRRLLQECKIGRGNATLLSEALAFAQPEDLPEKDIIKEFYSKCRASQELIFAQIPWASAGAERSRALALDTFSKTRSDKDQPLPLTREEKLLAELLKANEELTDALKVYADIERIGVEREAERAVKELSRQDYKLDRTRIQYITPDGSLHGRNGATESASRPISPISQLSCSAVSPPSDHSHPHRLVPTHRTSSPSDVEHFNAAHSTNNSHGQLLQGSLAPPVRIPLGPRSPAALLSRSRSPSPSRSSPASKMHSSSHSRNSSLGTGSGALKEDALKEGTYRFQLEQINSALAETLDQGVGARMPGKLSAKAMGKQKLVEAEESEERFDPDDMFYTEDPRPPYVADDQADNIIDDSEPDGRDSGTHGQWKRTVHYVYDAAAERTEEWMREGKHITVVNGLR